MARYPTGLLEEELKNKVAADWFAAYYLLPAVRSEPVCGASRVGVNRRSSYGLTPTAPLFVLP